MSKFCIIGSGISGATIANLLDKKHSVILFDKARGMKHGSKMINLSPTPHYMPEKRNPVRSVLRLKHHLPLDHMDKVLIQN